MEIWEAINWGHCSKSLLAETQEMLPIKVVKTHKQYSQSLCSLWKLARDFSNEALTTFNVNVFAPIWLKIKTKPFVIYGAQDLYQSIILLHYLSSDMKDIIDSVISKNGISGHLENILIIMLTDNRTQIRLLFYKWFKKCAKPNGLLQLQPL